MRLLCHLLTAVLTILMAADLGAQSRPRSESAAVSMPVAVGSPAVFRSAVDLVALSVVVTDAGQKLVPSLNADDFALFEDGVRQALSLFAAGQVPLDLALLLDTSASMSDKMKTMQAAATGFASKLQGGDRVSVVDIKQGVNVVHPLSSDVEGAVRAINGTVARGGTALYDGLYMTLKEMVKQRRESNDLRRQVLAVLSDGYDTASLLGFDDVLDLAKQASVVVYTITLQSPAAESGMHEFTRHHARLNDSTSSYSMRTLAQVTGGRAFFPGDIRELSDVYGAIAEELGTQYSLGYSSTNSKRDGTFRRVVVQIIDRPGLRTRTRSGYQAGKPASSTSR